MEDRIKAAFGAVRADEELKSSTKEFIALESHGFKTRRAPRFERLLPAAAAVCLAVVLVLGIGMYFTPTARISVDINPSLELEVNRFDRVISVNALNDDGKELAGTLDLKYADYDDALRRIIENKSVEAMLSNDEIMTITVIETNSAQSERILSVMKNCAKSYGNVYCHSASSEDASEAKKLGISCGKYREYLELHELDPDITPEKVQGLTMREIRDRKAALTLQNPGNETPPTTIVTEPPPTTSTGEPPTTSIAEPPPTNGGGHHGNGHVHGHE